VIDYGVPQTLTPSEVLLPALILLALAATTLVALARWPRAGFLGAWFFVTLAPTSSIVPIATEVGAERRMYLPLIAVIVLIVCGVFLAVAARRIGRVLAVASCAAVCIALATGTVLRNREYHSRLSLAQKTVERRPHGRAFLRLGVVLLESGRRVEALEYFRRARSANAVGARFVLGTEYIADGDLDAGIGELTEFVTRHPDHTNVVPAREMLGRAYAGLGRLEEAAVQFGEVLRRVPGHGRAHEQLGDILLGQGRVAEALPSLEFVAARRPGDVQALGKLGTALIASGRAGDAIPILSQAVAVDPLHAHARRMLGRALAIQGRLPDAFAELQRAVELGDHGAREDLQAVRSIPRQP
jgi:tetratricopeptide (TPR) repeat protein